MTGVIDSHCHLDDPRFAKDVPQVIERARSAGVEAMLTAGTDVGSSRRALDLASRYPSIYAAAGVHPHSADAPVADDELETLARHPRTVAIGETGLDYVKNFANRVRQEELLRRHVSLAKRLGKPLVLHCRGAFRELLGILSEDPVPGMVHCFSGTMAEARQALDLGLYLSLAGPLTYPSSGALREVVRFVPLYRLLLETDAPYLAPQSHRGQRNEPAYVREVARLVAGLFDTDEPAVLEGTAANARSLFRILP